MELKQAGTPVAHLAVEALLTAPDGIETSCVHACMLENRLLLTAPDGIETARKEQVPPICRFF